MILRICGLAWSLWQPTAPQVGVTEAAPSVLSEGSLHAPAAPPPPSAVASPGSPNTDAPPLEGTGGAHAPPSSGSAEGTQDADATPSPVDFEEVEVPADVRGMLERVTGEQLEAHALDSSDLGVVIRWRDRDSLELEIAIRMGNSVDDASKLVAACPQCSTEELAQRTLALLELAIAELKSRAAPPTPPPPVLVSSEPFRLDDASQPSGQERRWPVRRGLAAGLVAAGAAATIAGIVLAVVPKRVVILEENELYTRSRIYDYRPSGYVTLGIGAAALVGGAVWLAIEQRRAPKRPSKTRQMSRVAPGFTGGEVRF